MTEGSAVKKHRKWRPPDGYIPARPRHMAEDSTPKAEAEHGAPSDASGRELAMDHLSYLNQLSAARLTQGSPPAAADPKRHGVHETPLSSDPKEEQDLPPAHDPKRGPSSAHATSGKSSPHMKQRNASTQGLNNWGPSSPASITASSDASPPTGDARPISRPEPAKAVHKLSAVCEQVVDRYDPLPVSARAYVGVCTYVGAWAYPTLSRHRRWFRPQTQARGDTRNGS